MQLLRVVCCRKSLAIVVIWSEDLSVDRDYSREADFFRRALHGRSCPEIVIRGLLRDGRESLRLLLQF